MGGVRGDIPELDRAGLRQFGLTAGAALAVVVGALLPWIVSWQSYPRWPWYAGALLVLWALLAPATLRGLYRGWMRVAHVLGRITTPLLMGVVFFLVLTPVALVMRLAGRDPMRRALQPGADSYRQDSSPTERRDLERPF